MTIFYFINLIVAVETIQGRKLFAEIRYLYLPSPFSKSQRVIAKKAEYESIQELFFKVDTRVEDEKILNKN